jgi:hypothetical protein
MRPINEHSHKTSSTMLQHRPKSGVNSPNHGAMTSLTIASQRTMTTYRTWRITHVALDGTPLDPNIDRSDEVQALEMRYSNQFCQLRHEPHINVGHRANLQHPPPAENLENDQKDVCPYEHARSQVPTTNTVPVFDDLPAPEQAKPSTPDGKDPCFFTIWAPAPKLQRNRHTNIQRR